MKMAGGMVTAVVLIWTVIVSNVVVTAFGFVATSKRVVVGRRTFSSSLRSGGGEFDYLLGEGTATARKAASTSVPSKKRGWTRKNIVRVPDSSDAATLTTGSSDPFAVDEQQFLDPRLDDYLQPTDSRLHTASQSVSSSHNNNNNKSSGLIGFLRGKDFGELFITVFIPLTAGYWLSKYAYSQLSDRLALKAEQKLDDYANEMVYHDGDFQEMKMAHESYGKKMVWLGVKKKEKMLKAYLEVYAKKKTVSPQAISSLSYVFSINKLSEVRAAQILTDLCLSMPEKVASVGKLYFFGSHILKTPQAKKLLQPIQNMLASSYRDDVGVSGNEIVHRSQIAMGEAAYHAAVAAGGKNQGSSLTKGWKVLGLSKDTATRIYEEVKKEGFLSKREAKYGLASQKYDDKGHKIVEKGKPGDDSTPDNTEEEKEEEDALPTGNVFECGECGYTLFIAQGRDFKFYGADFKCPECGAEKDKFVGRHVEG